MTKLDGYTLMIPVKSTILPGQLNDCNQKLKPLNDEIERVSVFSNGRIEMYTARWVGNGSFKVTFNDGRNVECYVDDHKVVPDLPEINQEIRDKFQKLIVLREKLFAKVDE